MNTSLVNRHLCKLSWMLPVALLSFGCVAAPDDAEPVGQATQAFTGVATWSWGVTSVSQLDLGSDANQTCFLTGVFGNLTTSSGQVGQVDVQRTVGRYRLVVQPGVPGNPLGATVTCLPTVANRTDAVEWNTQIGAAQMLAPAAGNRRCFLTHVENRGPEFSAPQYFSSVGDSVRVIPPGNGNNNWYIGGTGNAGGEAVCVDVNGDYGSWEWVAGTGTLTGNLAFDTGGIQCLLTGVGGPFTTQSWTDGARVSENGLLQWIMTVTAKKAGWSNCVQ